MDDVEKKRRAFVAKLANENRKLYGTPDGHGALRAFELTFEHRWGYIFELVQNALDVGARSIELRLAEDGDGCTFQHDGGRSLDEKDVEGLSKVFRSTKGASSVGFMGIGFKSAFVRFQEALISGWGWKFRYEITQVVGEEYGDVQRDLLGSVVPIWDDAITPPEPGFTTRFELRRRTDKGADLESDLAHFLPDDDRTPLAILAASGLERLKVDDRVWELGVSEERDGSLEATALSESENRIWRLFPAQFQPSRQAIACFLEHRKIQPTEEERERVYADAARSRRVLGVLPLDNDGMPAPPTRGRVYATLPTEVTLPFGLHINADWLLNISRSGLRELEDNPWQRGIVDRIADILARFLDWSADTLAEPDTAKAAFKALMLPSPEAGGLETLLAEEHWLSRLRDRLEDAAVFPVWTEETSRLSFAKPGDVLVPPVPLAKAFRRQPELRPAVLLKGSVLMDDVLGPNALKLLRRIGLLAEMSPRDLEHTWEDGLESWWRTLPDEQENHRRLLFRIWAAVAELISDEAWRDADLPCIRSVGEKWLPVGKAVFLNERLPAESEPGGSETRRFMEPLVSNEDRLDDGWVSSLRQQRRKEPERALLSQAWDWIEDHARSISLQEIVEDAMNALMSSTNPDWSVLVPLGHWAQHRNRPDLLTHVLVESKSDRRGIPIGEALLADPYIEHGQDCRLLFSGVPAIAAVYLEEDPKGAGAHEWRIFFEKANAKGRLEVRPREDRAFRRERTRVAEFLGLDVGKITESNDQGYRLLDFDIEPDLPGSGAPKELRAALASWLDDGFRVLNDKGSRQTSYTYYWEYVLPGNKPSAWVTKLSMLAWVPCDDGELRRPQDVLPRSDPAREDAPSAQLSSELLSVLEQEGVKFGAAIPEATSLRRLSAVGFQLDAEELAQLLSECRKQVTTDTDRHFFDQALQNLTVPSSDSRRVPLNRIVQRVGGRLRGALGGWIVPLDRIEDTLRTELEHPDFPRDFPDTTTGNQALDYIRNVWKRARASPTGLANEVRDVLPIAYAYCLKDCAEDASLSEQWDAALPEALVFAGREWIVLTEGGDIYFDDIEDRRFFPSHVQLRTVTGGHLGRSRSERLRTAEAVGLPLLSSSVTMEWFGGDETLPVADDWVSRFDLICELLRQVRKSERVESDGTGIETGTGPRLIRVRELALDVSVGSAAAERVPVNARLHHDALTVAGRPVQFAPDAVKELLRAFSFGQRGNLAADLTGMLVAIADPMDFNLAADKFRRSHVPEVELSAAFRPDLDNDETAGSGDRPTQPADTTEPITGEGAGADVPTGQAPSSGAFGHVKSDLSGDAEGVDVRAGTSKKPEHRESGSTGGSYTEDRALARQNALAEQLKGSLKGKIAPNHEEDGAGEVGTTNRDSGTDLGDEAYREIAARYEREAGREPELGDPHQTGWDIRSTDPKTNEVRLIEVKGKGRPWDGNEVVELSRAQIRKAFKTTDEQITDSWYLYVVEKTDDGGCQVLPIANPVHVAIQWILYGRSWRMVAENPKRFESSPN